MAAKITVDLRMYNASGIGTYLRCLLPLIISLKKDFYFYLLRHRDNKSKQSWMSAENIEWIDCKSSIYSIAEQFELIRKIPGETDLYFSPHYNIPYFYGGRLIATIHDIFHLADENSDKTFLKNLYARKMISSALRKSKIIMTDSQFTLNEMKKYNLPGTDKVRVVYLGYGIDGIENQKSEGSSGKKYILYVGNVKPHKNLRRLIEAYKQLRLQNKIDIPLKIVGQADSFITGIPELREEISGSEWNQWIEFTGWIEDYQLAELYNNAALLVLPSLYEGFGLPPLEAMARGCPCVVSRAASLPEICGDAVLYCDPYDISDIADKMTRAVIDNDLRSDLIARGIKQAKKFSWQNTAETVIEVLDEALKI